MKISELTRLTGVTVATIKYYIREGLLAPGTPVSATQADYDRSHLERLRLIRTLVEVGGLSLTAVGGVLAALDEAEVVPTRSQRGALGPLLTGAHAALSSRAAQETTLPQQARAVVSSLGWRVEEDSEALRQLEAALNGLDLLGLPPSPATVEAYGRAALALAEADAAAVPPRPPAGTARRVVLGTVMYEPVLVALRRLAQQHVFSGGRP